EQPDGGHRSDQRTAHEKIPKIAQSGAHWTCAPSTGHEISRYPRHGSAPHLEHGRAYKIESAESRKLSEIHKIHAVDRP
nr:hypothetical protein [Bradyrhizobium sp.]